MLSTLIQYLFFLSFFSTTQAMLTDCTNMPTAPNNHFDKIKKSFRGLPSICTTTHAMNKPHHNNLHNEVSETLNDKKLEDWALATIEVPTPTRTPMLPLPNVKPSRLAITLRHTSFLLNNAETPEDFTKNFIHSITSKKNVALTLSEIAFNAPLCSKVITQLNGTTVKNNSKLHLPLHYCLGELNYYSDKMEEANKHYSQISKKDLSDMTDKEKSRVLKACVTTTETFGKKEIDHLSSLYDNIYDALKQEPTSAQMAYHMGLLTQTLLNNNSETKNNTNAPTNNSNKKKTNALIRTNQNKQQPINKADAILNGLKHLDYAQKYGAWNQEELKKTNEIGADFHTQLSSLYESKNNSIFSLEHMKQALKYRSQVNNNTQDAEIFALLTQAEKDNSDLYMQQAPYINMVLKCINNKPQDNGQQKTHVQLSTFAKSDLCKKLLPYCEESYKANKQSSQDILSLIALTHKNNDNYDKACSYIDRLSKPTPSSLLIKADIYAAAKKIVSEGELKTILEHFSNITKLSQDEQDIISSLIRASNYFFVEKQNHDLALKIIIKLIDLGNYTDAIELAYTVSQNLDKTNAKLWCNKLVKCKFYDKIDGPSYETKTNIAIGSMLLKTDSVSYEKKIAVFDAILDDKKRLSPEVINDMKDICGTLYSNWAMNMMHDKKECSRLFDMAIKNYDSGIARYNKAMFILKDSDNKDEINEALELLKKNTKTNNPKKVVSQIGLANLYLNCTNNPAVKKYIPLNIKKAIACLEQHNNNWELLERLCEIFEGRNVDHVDEHIRKEFINVKKSLEYVDILITTSYNANPYKIHRCHLLANLNEHEKALEEIDALFNAQNGLNKSVINLNENEKILERIDALFNAQYGLNKPGLTKEELLGNKIEILLAGIPNENKYSKALEYLREMYSSEKGHYLDLRDSTVLKKCIQHIITSNKMTDDEVEICCFAAESEIRSYAAETFEKTIDSETKQLSNQKIIAEQKQLVEYLLSAAKKGNINAQLILIPYFNATAYEPRMIDYHAAFNYAHDALFSSDSIKQKIHHDLLLRCLQSLTEKGAASAYYILCHFYEKNPKKLEETMLLFSQAPEQSYYRNDPMGMIGKIGLSCRDTLTHYINRSINKETSTKKKRKESPKDLLEEKINSLAAFTLGGMLVYSQDLDLIEAAEKYVSSSSKLLCAKFKLHHFGIPSLELVGNSYYKRAIIQKGTIEIIDSELLRKGVAIGHIDSIQKMAQIYIQQHKSSPDGITFALVNFEKNAAQKNEIQLNEFYHLLKRSVEKAVETNAPQNPHSLTLLEECTKIHEEHTKIYKQCVTGYDKLSKEKSLKPTINSPQNKQEPNPILERLIQLTFLATTKNMIRYQNYHETNTDYINSQKFMQQDNKEAATLSLQRAIKQPHAISHMVLALSYLTAELTSLDYNSSEKALTKALEYGLVIKNNNNKTKQFHNNDFLNWFVTYIEDLIKEDHPVDIKYNLLVKIKKTIQEAGINKEDLEELVLKIATIDLSKTPGWKTEKKKLDKTTLDNLRNSMIRDKEYEESITFMASMKAFTAKDLPTCFMFAKQAALEEKHGSGCLFVASDYLNGTVVPQNYLLAEKFLIDGLSYGLTKKQFCNNRFASTLSGFITGLIGAEHPDNIKKQFMLPIIKAFKRNNINYANFCTIVEADSNIDFSPLFESEYSETEMEETKPINVSDLYKKIVNLDNQKRAPLFLAALQAHQQQKTKISMTLMHRAVAEQNCPLASLILTCNNLEESDKTKIDYFLVEKFLRKALLYGLINQQFCNSAFLELSYSCIEALVASQHPSEIQSHLLSIIKESLIANKIDLNDFCTIVKEYSKPHIDLLSIPEWNTLA